MARFNSKDVGGRGPILVTGSHRSGSTWVGRILSCAPHTAYVHEPFSVVPGSTIPGFPFRHWFEYITDENAGMREGVLADTFSYRYSFGTAIAEARSPRQIGRAVREQWRALWHGLRSDRPIVKDPIAVFSAKWLAERFGMRVLVMIRHPAAFCSSLKVKGWAFDFNNFLDQPLLMRDWLEPFRGEITEYARKEKDIVDQGILLWRCIHYVIAAYRDQRPEWLFIRHEDLSMNPLAGFRGLFEDLGLEFTKKVESCIERSSGVQNPAEQQNGAEFRRNSRENVRNWERRLTDAEISKIRERTHDIGDGFYGEEDW